MRLRPLLLDPPALVAELGARIVHPPEDAPHFAPGYYSVLFEEAILAHEFAGVSSAAGAGGAKMKPTSSASGRTRMWSTRGARNLRQPAKSSRSSPLRSSRACASTARARAA